MRTKTILLAFIILYGCASKRELKTSATQQVPSNNFKNYYKISSQNSIQNPDTSMISRIDLTVTKNKDYQINYKADTGYIKILQPYFVDNICKPGDISHPLYKQLEKRANGISKEMIIKSLNSSIQRHKETENVIKEKLGNIENLNLCEFEFMPSYHLTPNVVKYKADELIDQYFHLDTSVLRYRMYFNKSIVSIITYENSNISGDRGAYMGPLDAEKLAIMNKLNVKPIGLGGSIVSANLKNTTLDIYGYGFLKENRLFTCEISIANLVSSYDRSLNQDKHIYQKELIVSLVDKLMFAPNSVGAITLSVEAIVRYINNYHKNK